MKSRRIQPSYERTQSTLNISVPVAFKDAIVSIAERRKTTISDFIRCVLVEQYPDDLKKLNKSSAVTTQLAIKLRALDRAKREYEHALAAK